MKKALKWLLPLLVLAASLGVAAVLVKTRKPAQPQPREEIVPLVRAIPVRKTDYQYTVTSQGSVQPSTEVQLAAELAGRVIQIAPSFAVGGAFAEGDILVQLDTRDFELALVRARAELARAQVLLQREEAESEVARQEWQRLSKGEPSALALRAPQLADARAAVAAASAAVEQAERDLSRCSIKAPFPGRVWAKLVDVGQYVQKGAVVARIYSSEYAAVRLPVPMDDLAYVELPIPGVTSKEQPQPLVTFSATIGGVTESWTGKVVRTEAEINARTRMLHAVARVDEPHDTKRHQTKFPLAVGLFVDAAITGNKVSGVVRLPRTALRGADQVLVVRENRLYFRKLKILRAHGPEVIVGAGLEDGEFVCTSPLDAVVEGMRVRVAGSDSLPQVSQPPPAAERRHRAKQEGK